MLGEFQVRNVPGCSPEVHRSPPSFPRFPRRPQDAGASLSEATDVKVVGASHPMRGRFFAAAAARDVFGRAGERAARHDRRSLVEETPGGRHA
eukprot:8166808-Alexandrium_andersonii.AAC.1